MMVRNDFFLPLINHLQNPYTIFVFMLPLWSSCKQFFTSVLFLLVNIFCTCYPTETYWDRFSQWWWPACIRNVHTYGLMCVMEKKYVLSSRLLWVLLMRIACLRCVYENSNFVLKKKIFGEYLWGSNRSQLEVILTGSLSIIFFYSLLFLYVIVNYVVL